MELLPRCWYAEGVRCWGQRLWWPARASGWQPRQSHGGQTPHLGAPTGGANKLQRLGRKLRWQSRVFTAVDVFVRLVSMLGF